MKILHWLTTFLPDVGGIQTFTGNLLPIFESKGHKQMMITDFGYLNSPPISRHWGVSIHRFNMLQPLLNKNPGDLLRTKIGIQKLFKEFDPDVVHIQPSGPEIIYAMQILKGMPKPTLVTLQSTKGNLDSHSSASPFGLLLSQADRVTAVSKDVKAWLLAVFDNVPQDIQVIENGIPPYSGKIAALPWEPPSLLSLSRLDPQKNVSGLLRAFAHVVQHHPAVRLKIAGTGSEEADLKRLASELELNGNVDFLGLVPPKNVPALINQTSIFVSASNYEGLSLSALEVAQMARPIVTTAVEGMSDVVLDRKSGLLVPQHDPVALANAISALLTNPTKAEAFGKAGRVHVESDFGIGQAAEKYDQLYRELAEVRTEVAA